MVILSGCLRISRHRYVVLLSSDARLYRSQTRREERYLVGLLDAYRNVKQIISMISFRHTEYVILP